MTASSLVDRIDRVVYQSDRAYRDAVSRPLFGYSTGGHPQLALPPPTTPFVSGATVSALVDAVDHLTKRLSRLESAFVVFESTFHEHFARGVLASTQNYRSAVQDALEPLRQSTRQQGAVLLDLVHTVNHLCASRDEDAARTTRSHDRGNDVLPQDLRATNAPRPQESHGPKYEVTAQFRGGDAHSSCASDLELRMRMERLKALQRDFLATGGGASVNERQGGGGSTNDNAASSSTPQQQPPSESRQGSPFFQSMVPLYTTTTSTTTTTNNLSPDDNRTAGTNHILRSVRNILRPPDSSDSTPPMLAGSSPTRGGHVTFASDVAGILSDASTSDYFHHGAWRGLAGAYAIDSSSHSDAYQELVHRLEL